MVIKLNLVSALQLRAAFMSQVIGMIVNDALFMVPWLFFTRLLSTENRWGVTETLGLNAMATLSFGIAFSCFAGVMQLPTLIHQGSFDNLLSYPRSLYMRILTSSFRVSALGDMIYGIILFIFYALLAQLNFWQMIVYLSLVPASVLIMINVHMVVALFGFIVPDAGSVVRNLFEIFLAPSIVPTGIFKGLARFFFIFIVPSMIVSSLPVEIARDMNLFFWLVSWGFALLWTFLARFMLSRMVRKYESGSLIGARI